MLKYQISDDAEKYSMTTEKFSFLWLLAKLFLKKGTEFPEMKFCDGNWMFLNFLFKYYISRNVVT